MGFGFENPAWLAALAAVVPLAWLYLRRRRRPPAVVSSLVLWRLIAKPEPPRRERRLPPLFYVQAVLLLAAATAAAGPFLSRPQPPGPPRDAVIVVDVSASMQAKHEGATRFDAARDAAARRARELGDDGKRVTVIAAALQPQVVGTGLDGAAAAAAIAALQPVDTAGNLTAAAELAATRAGADGSVDLFTDMPLDDLVMSRDARAATTVHRFGSGGRNVAIAAVRVDSNPFAESGRSRVIVTLRSFSDEPERGTLELAPLDAAAGAPIRRDVELAANASEVLAFDDIPWSGPFAARFAAGDDLPLDDVAYDYVPARRPLRVTLVTDDPSLGRGLDSLLRKAGGGAVRNVPPAAYKPEVGGDVTIFDRVAPPIPPAGNVAYLAPRQGNPDVAIVGETSDARFAEVRDHELLRGVQNPQTLLSGDLVGLAAGGALKPVLLGRAGGREAALAVAGEVGGRRIVATAFPIRPHSLADPDALPSLVFALNLLRWLSPESGDAPLQRLAGERLRAGSAGDPAITRVWGPDGTRDLGPTEEIALDHAGVYETAARDRTRPLLVSFVDPTESDIRRAASDAATATATPARRDAAASIAAATMDIPHAREALVLLIALMLVEWGVVALTSRRRTAEAAAAAAVAGDQRGGAPIGIGG